jgi:hypothetical protein
MNIKAIIVCSGEQYKTYDCEISVPALKIHLSEDTLTSLNLYMPKAQYTSILFMLEGNPVEVSVCKKENNFYASAKEISAMNLERMPKLKQNTLVQKYLGNSKESNENKEQKKEIVIKENNNFKQKKNNTSNNTNTKKVDLLLKQAGQDLQDIVNGPRMEIVAVPSQLGGYEMRTVTLQEADKMKRSNKMK